MECGCEVGVLDLWWNVLCGVFLKQKTAYEMRISDWSSDVCSSDLELADPAPEGARASRLGGAPDGAEVDPGTQPGEHGGQQQQRAGQRGQSTEERRVGKKWVSTCRSRWSPEH